MKQYHKIQTVFKRDPNNNYKTLLEGDYSLPEFEYLKDNEWIFTEKVDGTNIRVMFDGESITFGGKTDKAQTPPFLIDRLSEIFLPQLKKFKENFTGDNIQVCLYGEGYGERINKGGKYREGQGFVLFDVKIGHWWLQREDVEAIAKIFGLEVAPVLGMGTLSEMLDRTWNGFTSQWGNFIAEGIVARPVVELKARNGQRIITKIKYNDFARHKNMPDYFEPKV